MEQTRTRYGNGTGSQPMHWSQIRNSIEAMGMKVTRGMGGEYRVNFPGGTEDTAYYTDDAQDAIGTARLMVWTRLRAETVASDMDTQGGSHADAVVAWGA